MNFLKLATCYLYQKIAWLSDNYLICHFVQLELVEFKFLVYIETSSLACIMYDEVFMHGTHAFSGG